MRKVKRFDSFDDMAAYEAGAICAMADPCVEDHGHFSMVLSGGSTPRKLYEMLATVPYRDRMPWQQTHIFWGDERCVPPDHSDSNYAMASQALLSKVPIPAENIHRMMGETDPPARAADDYQSMIADFYRQRDIEVVDYPVFDMILSGVGDDGHTASLFPGEDSLSEKQRWVCAVEAPPYMVVKNRLTLTVPVFNNGSRVVFFVSGEKKRDIVNGVLSHPDVRSTYPAALIDNERGVEWLIDFDL